MAMTGTADSPPQRCIVVSGNYRTNIFGALSLVPKTTGHPKLRNLEGLD